MAKIINYEKIVAYGTKVLETNIIPVCSDCGAFQYLYYHDNRHIETINYCYKCGAKFEME